MPKKSQIDEYSVVCTHQSSQVARITEHWHYFHWMCCNLLVEVLEVWRQFFYKVTSVYGMKFSTHMKIQQHHEVAPSFNLWRSFNRSSFEDMSKQGSHNILTSSSSLQWIYTLYLLMSRDWTRIIKLGSLRTILATLRLGLMSCICQEHKLIKGCRTS